MKLLGLGDNTIDIYVDLQQQFPGGNAVNVAVLARRMGAETGYLGCLGTDPTGDLLYQVLTAEGVDLRHCRRPEGENARTFIAHNNGDRRFIRSQPGVRGAWGAFTAADKAYIGGFDAVHSSIYSELESVLPELRSSIRSLSFDFSERWSDNSLARLVPLVDTVFLSCPMGTDDDCAALLERCATLGATDAVVTRGVRGAMALGAGQTLSRPSAPAQVVDTLGAGDAFIAAYHVAAHGGANLGQRLDAAALAAAEACRSLGAFGHGMPWRAPGSSPAQTPQGH